MTFFGCYIKLLSIAVGWSTEFSTNIFPLTIFEPCRRLLDLLHYFAQIKKIFETQEQLYFFILKRNINVKWSRRRLDDVKKKAYFLKVRLLLQCYLINNDTQNVKYLMNCKVYAIRNNFLTYNLMKLKQEVSVENAELFK